MQKTVPVSNRGHISFFKEEKMQYSNYFCSSTLGKYLLQIEGRVRIFFVTFLKNRRSQDKQVNADMFSLHFTLKRNLKQILASSGYLQSKKASKGQVRGLGEFYFKETILRSGS